MSSWEPEEKNRLITALEKIAGSAEKQVDEAAIVASVYNAVLLEISTILDNTVGEFALRRELRRLVQKAQTSQ